MPWYLLWFGALIFLLKNDDHVVAYLKLLGVIGLCYGFGIILNIPYYWSRPLPDLISHFPLGIWSYAYLAAFIVASFVAFGIWRWSFNRREAQQQRYREIESRGELII